MLFSHFFNYWKMQRASRPPQDRTMVVACLAEVAQDMGPPIAGYVDVNFITLKYLPAIYFWSLECKKLCVSTGRSKCYQNSPLSVNCSLFLSQLTSLFIFHFSPLKVRGKKYSKPKHNHTEEKLGAFELSPKNRHQNSQATMTVGAGMGVGVCNMGIPGVWVWVLVDH